MTSSPPARPDPLAPKVTPASPVAPAAAESPQEAKPKKKGGSALPLILGGVFLLVMLAGSVRLRNLRANPAVSLTVLADDWYSTVTLFGRAVSLEPDADLAIIDRISDRYTGEPWRGREDELVVATVEVERWHAYGSPGGEG